MIPTEGVMGMIMPVALFHSKRLALSDATKEKYWQDASKAPHRAL
jgi:hypothetical protein